MTNKELKIQSILQQLQDLCSEGKDSVVLIHGDTENHKAAFKLFGNPQTAALSITSLLDTEPSELKRLLYSILTVYLSKNPQDLKMFEKGIEIAKQMPGVN